MTESEAVEQVKKQQQQQRQDEQFDLSLNPNYLFRTAEFHFHSVFLKRSYRFMAVGQSGL